MSTGDLNRIEDELNIRLPQVYREFMVNYPLPSCSGNADSDLWDDADEIIERNRRYRTVWVKNFIPWPTYLFFIGNSLCSASYAIDLRDETAPVWVVDHDAMDSKSTGAIASSFAIWAREYIEDWRADLIGDGINPNEKPS